MFLTPEGDNRGLYVDHKTGAGFDVRESQGGRSTIAFSYRIVGKPLGSSAQRLPLLSDVVAREAAGVHRPMLTPAKALRQLGIDSAALRSRAIPIEH